jgi:hypothetical protein
MLFSDKGHIMRYSVSAVSQLPMGSYFFCRNRRSVADRRCHMGREIRLTVNKQSTGIWIEGRRDCVFEWGVVVHVSLTC